MKKNCSLLSAIRIVSLLPPLFALLAYVLDIVPGTALQDLFWAVYFACGMLLLRPPGGESARFSLAAAVAQGACCIAMQLAAAAPHCRALCGAAVPFAHFAIVSSKAFRSTRPIPYGVAVHFCIETASYGFYHILVLLSGLAFLYLSSFSPSSLPLVAAISVGILLFAVLYLRAYSGRSLFAPAAFERRAAEYARGSSLPVSERSLSDSNSTIMYRRLTELMETSKPYLDPDLKLEKVTRLLFTNKTYLSRTIHDCSGRNFCQFVNWYRIQYAMDLMKRDPHLKVREVSSMSGFNSTVTFEVAFQYFTGHKPSEYLTVNLRK